ncbi:MULTISPECIES: hypothetical protein [Actinomycetes]|uniref:hypothetical protein n=1 Tax=Actinomycetes TaxID=1760 RepID=UPI00131A02D9|nr:MULTISPECIES: hypothetical protein [Actinomycetes]
MVMLDKVELELFRSRFRAFGKIDQDTADESAFEDVRSSLIDTIADVTDNPEVARAGLDNESIGVLMAIVKDLGSSSEEAAKSDGSAALPGTGGTADGGLPPVLPAAAPGSGDDAAGTGTAGLDRVAAS